MVTLPIYVKAWNLSLPCLNPGTPKAARADPPDPAVSFVTLHALESFRVTLYHTSCKESCRRWFLWQARTIAVYFSGIWFFNRLSWASSSRRASLAFPSWSPAWCSWWACSSLQFFSDGWRLRWAQEISGGSCTIFTDTNDQSDCLHYIILPCFAQDFASVSYAAFTKVSCLLSFHGFLILANLTTWEHISWRHITYLMLASCVFFVVTVTQEYIS